MFTAAFHPALQWHAPCVFLYTFNPSQFSCVQFSWFCDTKNKIQGPFRYSFFLIIMKEFLVNFLWVNWIAFRCAVACNLRMKTTYSTEIANNLRYNLFPLWFCELFMWRINFLVLIWMRDDGEIGNMKRAKKKSEKNIHFRRNGSSHCSYNCSAAFRLN